VPRASRVPARRAAAAVGLDAPETSMLDLIDRVLNKGVVATGDVTLGVAGVDLIYVRLSALLCAADRVLPEQGPRRRRRPPAAHRLPAWRAR
jgi:hypothetical protein